MNKDFRNIINKILLFLLVGSTLWMCVGYAAINSIVFNINGYVTGVNVNSLYISEVLYKEGNNINSSESKINNYYDTILNSSIVLNDLDNSSSITYTITFSNGTNFDYKYVDYVFDEEFYSNSNIIVDVNLKNGNIIYSGDTLDIEITFKYVDGVNVSSEINRLDSYLKFNFIYIESLLNGSDPVFSEDGIIPVTISNDGVATTADLMSDWYKYGDKRWANMVLVKENGSKTRSYYKNNDNIIVSSEDILAYYVWIPRFSYTFYTGTTGTNLYAGGSQSAPGSIDIKFVNNQVKESGTATYISSGNGIEVANYYTHPAFSFGSNNEISGFWFAKFEISNGDSSNAGAGNPVVLPNKNSLAGQNASTQFKNAILFTGGSFNTSTGQVTHSGSLLYGLSNNSNSHMVKNSEWGAVSYLSHSIYGINSEIRINNYYANSSFKTGCGGSAIGANTATSCSISYGESNSYPQSSTGNINGVFDMSGGGYDRVMGNFNAKAGSSGFSKFPTSEYVNTYTASSVTSCSLSECGGHALYETNEWYTDLSNFNNASYPFTVRGGGYSDKGTAGAFYFGRNNGYSSSLSVTRNVLIV